jgi:hypothetical protein
MKIKHTRLLAIFIYVRHIMKKEVVKDLNLI